MNTSTANVVIHPQHFLSIAGALGEALMLVAGTTGEILAVTPKAMNLLGIQESLEGKVLTDIFATPAEQITEYLKKWSRSRTPLPFNFMFHQDNQECQKKVCEGFLLQPATADTPPYIVLRCVPAEQKANQFVALNKEVEKQKETLHKLQQSEQALFKAKQELEDRNRELEQANGEILYYAENLEKIVCERTVQLEKANSEISELNGRLKLENRRMGAELEITRRLQQMVLPTHEELSAIHELDIAVFMEPANEVGGDYYDILQHNGNITVGIGDVTGHGLESGVLMLMVQTAVRALLASEITDAKSFLNALNSTIYGNVQRMHSDKNLTLSLLNYHEGAVKLCGQHEETLVVRHSGAVERIDTFNLGFMVGLEADISHLLGQREIYLAPGDGVVLYTDGITEAMNPQKQQYGVKRLCEIVSQHWHEKAQDIQQAVISDLRGHLGKCELKDDITLLILKQPYSHNAHGFHRATRHKPMSVM